MPGKLSGMENMAAQYQPSNPTQSWGTASDNGPAERLGGPAQQSPYQNQAPWQAPYKAPQQMGQQAFGQQQFDNLMGRQAFGQQQGMPQRNDPTGMMGQNDQMGRPNALSGQMSASERQQNPYQQGPQVPQEYIQESDPSTWQTNGYNSSTPNQRSSMPTQAQGIPQGGPRSAGADLRQKFNPINQRGQQNQLGQQKQIANTLRSRMPQQAQGVPQGGPRSMPRPMQGQPASTEQPSWSRLFGSNQNPVGGGTPAPNPQLSTQVPQQYIQESDPSTWQTNGYGDGWGKTADPNWGMDSGITGGDSFISSESISGGFAGGGIVDAMNNLRSSPPPQRPPMPPQAQGMPPMPQRPPMPPQAQGMPPQAQGMPQRPPMPPQMQMPRPPMPPQAQGIQQAGRYLNGPSDGMADKVDIEAADGEFVVPADVVGHLGNGNSDAGATQLYDMMERIRRARTGNPKQGEKINPNDFMLG